MRHSRLLALLITSLAGTSCTDKTDADYRADVIVSIHDSIATDLDQLVQAAYNLQAASPSRAWDATRDAEAITEMRDAWKRARTAYEHVEGAVVSLFPGIDTALDARYEEMLAKLGPDPDPFDGRGVTGMHGIERILFSPTIRSEVVAFEAKLPGYLPAGYPATDDEAIEFKTVLVQLLIDKATSLRKQWQPAVIDVGTAYRGLVGLMYEAEEKVNLAITGEEESRYANITLFDLRSNLDGTQKVYDLFRDWVHSKAAGTQSDIELRDTFDQLGTLYATVTSDAIPSAPVDWRHDQPTAANLATPFGAFWQHIHESVDPNSNGSVVFRMNHVASLLGLPTFVEP
jgi:iron uptake system component EfeO